MDLGLVAGVLWDVWCIVVWGAVLGFCVHRTIHTRHSEIVALWGMFSLFAAYGVWLLCSELVTVPR